MSNSYFKKIIVCSLTFFLLLLTGCTAEKRVDKQIDLPKREAAVKELSAFKKLDDTNLLYDSIELPYYDGYTFTPVRFTDNGYLLGELKNSKDSYDKYFAYLDVNTKIYHKVKKLEEYESIPKEYLGYVYKDLVYYAITNDNGIDIYEYDSNKKQSKKLNLDMHNSCPVRIKDTLYYLSSDMDKQSISLCAYDFKTKDIRTLLIRKYSDNDGMLQSLASDGNNLYIFVAYGQEVYCYKMDVNTNVIEPYFHQSKLELPYISGDFMTFSQVSSDNTRIHPKEYLIDIVNNINYEYNDGIILPSKKGIVWVKYLVDEKDIPKGEVFMNQYTKLMYKPL